MSIIAVGLALSAEPLRDLRDRNRLSGEVARFQESLRLARTEAVMRNIAVSLCPSHMASSGAPVCNGDYGEGWIVFSNADRDRNVDAEDDEVLRIFEGLPPGFRVTRGGSDSDDTAAKPPASPRSDSDEASRHARAKGPRRQQPERCR